MQLLNEDFPVYLSLSPSIGKPIFIHCHISARSFQGTRNAGSCWLISKAQLVTESDTK